MSKYDDRFYSRRHAGTVHAAREVLAIVRDIIPGVQSAVDLGCGVGTWLAVLCEQGVTEFLGIEGPWFDPKHLQIPASCFLAHDLAIPFVPPRRFDLAISIEVAEHLPQAAAPSFVNSLTNLSDFVLFSAAIPYQLGVGHLNEQWPQFWADLFRERGYAVVDEIRGRIWNDKSIPVWYRQNLLLMVKESRAGELQLPNGRSRPAPLSIVHPEQFLERARIAHLIINAWEWLPSPLRRWSSRLVWGPE